MRKSDEPIIVEQTFDQEIGIVWKAITDIKQMRRWYFENIPSFKPEVGFTTKFRVESQGRIFLHMWKVIEVIPMERISYNWKYDKYQGDSNVVFELSRLNKVTKLILTHHILESFTEDIPEFARESCLQGWEFFIKQRLKDYLEKLKK
jgi:uncharacterized protein YndB with AHSA1/START domain